MDGEYLGGWKEGAWDVKIISKKLLSIPNHQQVSRISPGPPCHVLVHVGHSHTLDYLGIVFVRSTPPAPRLDTLPVPPGPKRIHPSELCTFEGTKRGSARVQESPSKLLHQGFTHPQPIVEAP